MNKLGQNILIQLLLAGTQIIFSLITYPIIARTIAAEGLGRISHAESFVQFITLFFSIGIPAIGAREIAVQKNSPEGYKGAMNRLFSVQLICAVPACLVMLAVGYLAGIASPLLLLSVINVLFSCLNLDWYFHGLSNFRFLAFRTMLVRILTITAILLLVQHRGDLYLYYALLVGNVVANFLLNFYKISPHFSFLFAPEMFRKTLKGLGWIYAFSVFTAVYTMLDVALMDMLAGKQEIGYYSFAYKLIRMSSLLLLTIGVVFLPKIAFHHSVDDHMEVEQQVKHAQQAIYLLGWPICLTFFVLAPEIVQVLGGNAFKRSIDVFRILCTVPLIVGLSHLATMQIMVPLRHEKPVFYLVLGGAIVSVVCNVLLIPNYLEQGAAITYIVVEAIVMAGALLYLLRRGLFVFNRKAFINGLASALVLIPVVFLFRLMHAPAAVVLFGSIVIALPLHLLMQWFLFPKSGLRSLIAAT